MQEETNMIRLMVELNLFVHRKWRKQLKMQGNLWLNAHKCIKKKSVCKYFSGQIIFGINKKKIVFLSLLHTDNLNFEPWILEIKFPSVYYSPIILFWKPQFEPLMILFWVHGREWPKKQNKFIKNCPFAF